MENELEEGADDEDHTVDESNDEEIRFLSNAFDVLKGSAASAPPPAKKLKQNTSLATTRNALL